MRRTIAIWWAVASVVFSFISSGFAADLSRPVYKAPAYYAPEPVFSWTGFYIGVNGGYGWSRFTGTGTFGADSVTAKGWLAGATVGYNYQMGRFVLGVEGDFDWANVKYDTPLFAGTLTLKNDYFITAAARLGYAFDRTLLYGKVGAAWTRDKYDGNDGAGGTVTATSNRTGWMLGAGVEYAIWQNVSAKLEYDYLQFNGVTPSFATTGGLAVIGTSSVSLKTQIVKAGLNYRFSAF
ncbi:outer membrane protein [Pseudolabrys sp. Root1462]|jgi:outer membrane immunogenic protein|uniref:outer membrane protein n=1 Tax=Pseudolabrys sp. Root1462 TaxID=1736466 RepID=UPI0009E96A08|nr:outer membrane protein [Pseudolabrys sp. Root1462]